MKKSFLLCLSLVITSCSGMREREDEVFLAESEQRINLRIDSNVNLHTFAMHLFSDTTGVDYLTIENNQAFPYNIISFYRLDSCKLSHIVKIHREGPNAVVGMMGHGVLGLDEIIVSSSARPMLYKIDRDGTVIHTYDCTDDKGINTVSVFNSLIYTPLIYKEGNIYMTQLIPYTRWNGDNYGNNFEFDQCPVALVLDTATGKFHNPSMSYPEIHKKDKLLGHNENFSRIFDGKRFVYSFFALPDLYVSEDMNTVTKYVAASKYIGDINYKGYKENTDTEQASILANTATSYGNIIYDKYRDVYYRFCFLKDDIKTMPREYIWSRGDFSIMIIDNNFNIIGETAFRSGQYAPLLFFVNKDGLWLSENNYMRPDMTDEELVFKCLKLEKK